MARAPDERIGKAKELFDQGLKLIEIANQLDVPEGTVRSWKNRYKWDNETNATLQKNECNVAKEKKHKKQKVAVEIEQVCENPELTDKQRLFCVLYIKCFNATKAYQKAYGCSHETAAAIGYRLLENVGVKEEIRRLKRSRMNREMLDEHDIFQKYMDIAFADITDFVTFGQEKVHVMSMYGPVEIKDPETGEKVPLMKTVNTVRFRQSEEVDGTLISEVKQGKDGASIKLVDRMKALEWLSDHMNLATEEQRTRIEVMKRKAQLDDDEEIADDGFLQALAGTAAEDWADEED